MSDLFTLRVRDCTCPESPHPDGDEIYFAPHCTLAAGMAAVYAVKEAGDDPMAFEALVGRALLFYNLIGWNFVTLDAKGRQEPIIFERSRIEELLPWDQGGFEAAERANDLYAKDVIAPLLARMQRTSGAGRTAKRTRPTRRTRSGVAKPSGSSSPTPVPVTSAA